MLMLVVAGQLQHDDIAQHICQQEAACIVSPLHVLQLRCEVVGSQQVIPHAGVVAHPLPLRPAAVNATTAARAGGGAGTAVLGLLLLRDGLRHGLQEMRSLLRGALRVKLQRELLLLLGCCCVRMHCQLLCLLEGSHERKQAEETDAAPASRCQQVVGPATPHQLL